MAINFSGVLHGEKIFGGNALHFGAGRFDRADDAGNFQFADEFGMALDERGNVRRRRGLADGVGNINGEEIGRTDKAVHGFEADVVGVNVPRFLPAKFLDSLGGGGADAGRFGADDRVFAIGFVPDRNNLHALFGGEDARLKLRLGLMSKAITHAERESADLKCFLFLKCFVHGVLRLNDFRECAI
jgi:hypothetical protein